MPVARSMEVGSNDNDFYRKGKITPKDGRIINEGTHKDGKFLG